MPASTSPRPAGSGERSGSQPKGILKRTDDGGEGRSPQYARAHMACPSIIEHLHSLTWDEPNLALNDLNRDSTMKITEPKTPFVRYNPETDEVMNMDTIPDFNLGRSTSSNDGQAAAGASNAGRPPSRRSSESSEKRQVFVEKPDGGVGVTGPDGTDEEEAFMDTEAKAKHEAFVQARKGHYGNEAEAMKIARALADEEQGSEAEDSTDDSPTLSNGSA